MIMKSDGSVMSGLNNLIAGHKTDWTKNTLVKYKQSRKSTSKTKGSVKWQLFFIIVNMQKNFEQTFLISSILVKDH